MLTPLNRHLWYSVTTQRFWTGLWADFLVTCHWLFWCISSSLMYCSVLICTHMRIILTSSGHGLLEGEWAALLVSANHQDVHVSGCPGSRTIFTFEKNVSYNVHITWLWPENHSRSDMWDGLPSLQIPRRGFGDKMQIMFRKARHLLWCLCPPKQVFDVATKAGILV